MLRSLRRLRWLASFLIIASPAVGGQVLSLLHPCPAVLGEAGGGAATSGHDHAAATENGSSDHSPGQSCSCLGSCNAPAVVATPTANIATSATIAAPQRPSWPLVEARAPVATAADLLPPKTAPPLV